MSAPLALFALVMLPTGGGPIYGPPAPVQRTLPDYDSGVGRDVGQLRSDIDQGRTQRQLSRRQARELRREASEIGMLQERYAAGGLTESERAELRTRVEALRGITTAKRLGTIK